MSVTYPDLTDFSLRFDAEIGGVMHHSITLRTVRALIPPAGSKLFLRDEHVYTFDSCDRRSASGLFWGYTQISDGEHLYLWSADAHDRHWCIAPGDPVPPGQYTIAAYGGVLAFGRVAARALIAERDAKHGPSARPTIYLHTAHTARAAHHVGEPPEIRAVFDLKWGESAPPAVVDHLLKQALAGRRLVATSLSLSPTESDGRSLGQVGVYGKTMLGATEVAKLVRGAKLEEVWTCK